VPPPVFTPLPPFPVLPSPFCVPHENSLLSRQTGGLESLSPDANSIPLFFFPSSSLPPFTPLSGSHSRNLVSSCGGGKSFVCVTLPFPRPFFPCFFFLHAFTSLLLTPDCRLSTIFFLLFESFIRGYGSRSCFLFNAFFFSFAQLGLSVSGRFFPRAALLQLLLFTPFFSFLACSLPFQKPPFFFLSSRHSCPHPLFFSPD